MPHPSCVRNGVTREPHAAVGHVNIFRHVELSDIADNVELQRVAAEFCSIVDYFAVMPNSKDLNI